MKLLYFFLATNITITTLAQSKKEQLEILTYRIDSLNATIIKLHFDLQKTDSILQLNKVNNQNNLSQIAKLKDENRHLELQNNKFESELNSMYKELNI
jgi:hypothetical protein